MQQYQDMNLWRPTSESEIKSAIEAGTVAENHYLDFKRELGAGESARKEMARDLASFALHGGVIVVGVDEPTEGRFELAPVLLEGISERVEQIAANRLDPGLFLRTSVIQSAADVALGYLVIEVQPSLSAPHMVEGQYWGRSERTKQRLSDPDVVKLHAARVDASDRVRAALEEELDRDPAPRPPARLFLVAEPLQADSGLARTFVRGHQNQMINFSDVAESAMPGSVRGMSYSPYQLSSAVRRSRGIARTNLGDRRAVHPKQEAFEAEDIEVQFTGAIRLLTSDISYEAQSPRIVGDVPFLRAGHVTAWVHRLICYAAHLGPTLEYRGPWGFGVHLYGLNGVRADAKNRQPYQMPVYDVDTFEEVATAQLTEMIENPNLIAERLIGDLIHALGVAEEFSDALAPAR